jgi:cell division protein FtsB
VRGGSRRSAFGARRVAFWIAAAAIAYFAVQGGEYGTVALVRQRLAQRTATRAIASLEKQIDSLARFKQAVLTDPAVQERIAREEFGMIKQKEILYRFAAPADSGARAPRP